MGVISESRKALGELDWEQVNKTIHDFARIRDEGRRVFVIGNGGGYAHAMHFASDLRKIARMQTFSFDNAAEMTARINDDGWESAWVGWYNAYGPDEGDEHFIFSVGGAISLGISDNVGELCADYGIVGAYGNKFSHRIAVPSTSTPVIEGCQSVIAHHIVDQLAQ